MNDARPLREGSKIGLARMLSWTAHLKLVSENTTTAHAKPWDPQIGSAPLWAMVGEFPIPATRTPKKALTRSTWGGGVHLLSSAPLMYQRRCSSDSIANTQLACGSNEMRFRKLNWPSADQVDALCAPMYELVL